MKRYQNLLMMIAVIVLVAVPLWMVQKPAPGPDGKEVEIFKGADDQAKDVIKRTALGFAFTHFNIPCPPSKESARISLRAEMLKAFKPFYDSRHLCL